MVLSNEFNEMKKNSAKKTSKKVLKPDQVELVGKARKEPAVVLKRVTKTYTLRHTKPTLTDMFFAMPGKGKVFTALDKVDLTIYKGEKVGIIGRNGSGKTTLLKVIAGITTPNSGEVIVHGKVVSLIDLAAGFHEDLTGSENIFLNGTVIGMSRQELEEKYDQIVAFADIGEFIDQPLYTYSSGMALRLGFSIAVHADPDIFLLDEGFAVGDEDFKRKCELKIDEFGKKGKTVVMVSHWLEYLERMTNRLVRM